MCPNAGAAMPPTVFARPSVMPDAMPMCLRQILLSDDNQHAGRQSRARCRRAARTATSTATRCSKPPESAMAPPVNAVHDERKRDHAAAVDAIGESAAEHRSERAAEQQSKKCNGSQQRIDMRDAHREDGRERHRREKRRRTQGDDDRHHRESAPIIATRALPAGVMRRGAHRIEMRKIAHDQQRAHHRRNEQQRDARVNRTAASAASRATARAQSRDSRRR